jgi:hypothetical protein
MKILENNVKMEEVRDRGANGMVWIGFEIKTYSIQKKYLQFNSVRFWMTNKKIQSDSILCGLI